MYYSGSDMSACVEQLCPDSMLRKQQFSTSFRALAAQSWLNTLSEMCTAEHTHQFNMEQIKVSEYLRLFGALNIITICNTRRGICIDVGCKKANCLNTRCVNAWTSVQEINCLGYKINYCLSLRELNIVSAGNAVLLVS